MARSENNAPKTGADKWREMVGSPAPSGGDDSNTVAIERFAAQARGDRALVQAFVSTERLTHETARKLTLADWQADFTAWCNQSRA